eukprot:1158580-Pelagomonas_calceolata.AAC.11
MQFSALKMIRTRTYTCDHIMSAIDHAGFLAAEEQLFSSVTVLGNVTLGHQADDPKMKSGK